MQPATITPTVVGTNGSAAANSVTLSGGTDTFTFANDSTYPGPNITNKAPDTDAWVCDAWAHFIEDAL